MPAYIIAEVHVINPEAYAEYRTYVPATLEAYGGRYLAGAGDAEPLEGNWLPARIVLLQFDSLDRAKQWWSSEEYRLPKALRQRCAYTRMILVDGVPPT